MRYIATLLLVSDSASTALEPLLISAGYGIIRCRYGEVMGSKVDDQTFDLMILDGENNSHGVDVRDIARKFRRRDFPLLLVSAADIRCRIQTISPGYCHDELLARVGALIRLRHMEQELNRRIHTTESYGVDISSVSAPEAEIGDANVLIVGMQTMLLGNVLLSLDTRTNIHICKHSGRAIEELRRGTFDAVILSGVGLDDSNLRLCADIRADSRLFNLPVVMVLENPGQRAAAYQHGVSDIVLHGSEMDALPNRLGLQIRQHRYRLAIQTLFRVAKPYPVVDGPTDLYSAGFMRAHLALQFRDCAAQNKVLSIASLMVENLAEVTEEHGFPAADQLLRQVGSALGSLIRGEDFCASLTRGQFLISLPGARRAEADVVLRRLEGVLRSTDFALVHAAAPAPTAVRAAILTGVAEVRPGDDIESVIARGLSEPSRAA